jgi:hypothetical protein
MIKHDESLEYLAGTYTVRKFNAANQDLRINFSIDGDDGTTSTISKLMDISSQQIYEQSRCNRCANDDGSRCERGRHF